MQINYFECNILNHFKYTAYILTLICFQVIMHDEFFKLTVTNRLHFVHLYDIIKAE